MKSLIFVFLFSISLFAGEWTHKPKAEKIGDEVQYKYQATFTGLDTLTSLTKVFLKKDYDAAWTTHPFTAFWNVTAADSITATVATWYIYGVVEGTRFVVDTLSVNIGTKADSSNYTTLNFNDRKFPEYQVDAIGDSCTSKLVIF